MSTYEPGTVAVATVRGVPNVRVAYADPEDREMPWMVLSGPEAGVWAGIVDVTDIRTLVVLDHSHILDAVNGLDTALHDFDWFSDDERSAVSELRDQIEQQTKPPRIPEPGLWGVVSVERPDGLTDYYTCGPGGWFSERGEHFNWESLPGIPTLVRPGIEDGAS